jgi:hypothetical protein
VAFEAEPVRFQRRGVDRLGKGADEVLGFRGEDRRIGSNFTSSATEGAPAAVTPFVAAAAALRAGDAPCGVSALIRSSAEGAEPRRFTS